MNSIVYDWEERGSVGLFIQNKKWLTKGIYIEAEEKIRIVLEGLRAEESIAELCRREGIATNLYYSWSKEFLEAGKRRLKGDTKRQATSGEVMSLRKQNSQLKELVADLSLKNVVLKKSLAGTGEDLDE
jgi:transposase